MTPDELRNTILIHRNKLEVKDCNCIFSYVNFRTEVETRPLLEKLLKSNKIVTVPVTRVKEKRLDVIKIKDLERDLVPGYCSIPEPSEKQCKTNRIEPEKIDVILLPGSVFDTRCGRMGYGGGYYDRFLSAIPGATRIGLAFALQIVEKAPLQPHDERLDYVITESGIIKGCKR